VVAVKSCDGRYDRARDQLSGGPLRSARDGQDRARSDGECHHTTGTSPRDEEQIGGLRRRGGADLDAALGLAA